MMNSNGNLLIDLFSILPEAIDCYIQAPSLEDETVLNLMSSTVNDYYKLIRINRYNKDILITQIKSQSVHEYFHKIQIKENEKLLFEGYDGVDFGILSKSLTIPQWFKEEYIDKGDCAVSDKW